MIINESKAYKKTERKVLKKNRELKKLENIKNIIINSNNLKELMNSDFKYIYDIRKKDGNLK